MLILSTDSHFTGWPFWHILENRPQNPENQPTSNCCRNRASWRILMKPTANERVRLNFSRFFEIFYFYQFFYVLQLFEHRPDSHIRIYLKKPKMCCFQGKRWVFRVTIFWKQFSEVFYNPISRKRSAQIWNCIYRSRDAHFGNFRFPNFDPNSYIKSLRKNKKKLKISKMSYRELSFLPIFLNQRESVRKPISRSDGSWGKVKIPKCAHFDGFFGKTKIFEKNHFFT